MAFEVSKVNWKELRADLAHDLYRVWRAATFRPLMIDTGGGPRRDGFGHAWTNLWVDTGREHPYLMGHVHMVKDTALLVGVIVWLLAGLL